MRPGLDNRHLKEGHGRYFPASGLTFETFEFGLGLDNRQYIQTFYLFPDLFEIKYARAI